MMAPKNKKMSIAVNLERLGNGGFGSSSSPDLAVFVVFLEAQPRLVVAIVPKAL